MNAPLSRTELFRPDEIIRAWECYVAPCSDGHLPGDPPVVEVRVLHCRKRGANFPATWSGYFDNPQSVVAGLAQFSSWSGCYFTINPVDPVLLARSHNRFKVADRGATTSDKNIPRRKWLPIDLDPIRPTGISSSAEELQAASDLARVIAEFLNGQGWPWPLLCMSGNGYHLCYPIDLPADDGGLVGRVLQTLSARFTTDRVSVDTTSFNPSRIWKLPGTLACKGDSIPGREHRFGEIAYSPYLTVRAPREALEALAGAATPPLVQAYSGEQRWDLLAFIEEYNLDTGPTKAWDNGGSLVLLNECPCCEHGGDGPWLAQHASGAMSAGCHHNSCRGRWGWQELKKAVGARPLHPPVDELPGIDRIIANMLTRSRLTPKHPDLFKFAPLADPGPGHANASLPEPPEHPEHPEHPEQNELLEAARDIPVPYDALDVPGLIGQIMRYNLQTAYSPQPELAFAGALCLMSAIVSRKVIDSRGTTPNVYVLGLAPTCSGKEHARYVNNSILQTSGDKASKLIGNAQLGSNSGAIKSLERSGFVSFFQIDEISRMIKMSGNPNSNLYRVGSFLLEIFSKANDIYISDALADAKKITTLHRPHVIIYGTATDSGMWDSFAAESLTNGLVGRFIIVPGRRDTDVRDSIASAPPVEIVNRVRDWSEWTPPAAGNLSGPNAGEQAMVPMTIRRTDEAAERFLAHSTEIRQRMSAEDDTKRAIWGRSAEKVAKMALLFACSRNHAMEGTQITIDDVERAITIGNWTTRYTVAAARLNVSNNQTEADLKKVFRIIAKAGQAGMTIREVSRRTQWIKHRERSDILRSLVEAGSVEVESRRSATQPATIYRVKHIA